MPAFGFSTWRMEWRYQYKESGATTEDDREGHRQKQWEKLELLIASVLEDFPEAKAAVANAVRQFVDGHRT